MASIWFESPVWWRGSSLENESLKVKTQGFPYCVPPAALGWKGFWPLSDGPMTQMWRTIVLPLLGYGTWVFNFAVDEAPAIDVFIEEPAADSHA